MPAVIFPREEQKVLARLRRARREGATDLLITNPGQLFLVKDEGFTLHGDWRLNVTNSFAPLVFVSLNCSSSIRKPAMVQIVKPTVMASRPVFEPKKNASAPARPRIYIYTDKPRLPESTVRRKSGKKTTVQGYVIPSLMPSVDLITLLVKNNTMHKR